MDNSKKVIKHKCVKWVFKISISKNIYKTIDNQKKNNVNNTYNSYKKQYQMIYASIRAHMGPYGPIYGPYGPIFVARGEQSQVEKVKINISDRDLFLGLFQADPTTIKVLYKLYNIIYKWNSHDITWCQHGTDIIDKWYSIMYTCCKIVWQWYKNALNISLF